LALDTATNGTGKENRKENFSSKLKSFFCPRAVMPKPQHIYRANQVSAEKDLLTVVRK
jgi:hypothetical protein